MCKKKKKTFRAEKNINSRLGIIDVTTENISQREKIEEKINKFIQVGKKVGKKSNSSVF